MLKTLIYKQFYECFKGYFINNKTGKAKSKAAVIGMFLLFGFLLISLAASFFGMSLSISVLLETEYSWLYYAIFGIVAIALGTFASVFNTSNSLYNAKDNDLLLSMPIKPSNVLLSRIVLVYGLSILYISIAWLPICINPIIFHHYSPLLLIPDLVLLLALGLFVSVLSCAFGYIVAIITNKTKNKSIITVLLSLLFLGGYYFVCFRFETIINSFVENSDKVANTISTWLNIIYQLAQGAQGNILGFIIFVSICLVLGLICFGVLERSFYKIVINSNKVSTTSSKIKYKAKTSAYKTLLSKEFKRFIGSPIYLLNMGLGCIFIIAIAIGFLIKKNDISEMILQIQLLIPEINNYIPFGIIAIIGLVTSMCGICVPSISLEGKNLWILKSLPINPIEILNAKRNVHFITVLIPSVLSGIIMCYAFNIEYSLSIYICINILICSGILSYVGSFLSLINPNFTWTSEVQPIKQSLNILVYMLIGLVFNILIVAVYYLLRNKVSVNSYLTYMELILFVIYLLLGKLLERWGTNKFESL